MAPLQEYTVLILAPIGHDAPAIAALLGAEGVSTHTCLDPADCVTHIVAGAGALLLTEESLELPQAGTLFEALAAQPAWSELPLIALTRGGEHRVSSLLDLTATAPGTVTFLERPMSAATLLRSVQVALHSRRRQYQVRDLLAAQQRHQQELDAQRELLQTMINHIPALVNLIRGSDLRLQLVSPSYQALAPGLPMLGRTLDELWSETGQDFTAICRRVLETGETYHVEDQPNLIRRRPDSPLEKAYFTWSLHRVPLPGAEGWGLLNTGWETTQRKQAEEKLRESEERLRLAANAARLFAFEWDPVSDYVRREGDAPSILGVPFQEETGASFFARVHPEDQARFIQLLRSLRPGSDSYSTTYRVLRPDDTEAVLEESGQAFFDAQGRFVRLIGMTADVTARKRAEDALRDSEARFRTMADGTPVIIWVTDTQGAIRFVNRTYCDFFGVTLEQVQAGGWQPLLHPDDAATYRGAFLEALNHHQAFFATARVRRHDGVWRWVESYAEPLYSASGEFLGMAGSSPDVTERKQFQAELERLVAQRTAKLNELVGELEHFSYTITHDMRAPLRAMRGFAELVQELCGPCPHPEQKGMLRRIISAAERMDLLITDALSYSKAVRQELPLGPVDLDTLLRGMLDSYPEFQAAKAQIRLEGHLPVVLGNQAGLTQVFSNLLGNAIKFAKPGQTPQVRIWTEPQPALPPPAAPAAVHHPSPGVRIWVEDHGIGISPLMLRRVFNMFARGTDTYPGSGIGLALVRKVVDRMGGHVGVESEEGQGSRFWVELPVGDPRVPPSVLLPTPPPDAQSIL
jgi:PAS domain S-box-containing protein